MRYRSIFASLALGLLLCACSGGGDPGVNTRPPSSDSATPPESPTTPTTPVSTPTLSIGLFGADGVPTTTIGTSTLVTARATLKDGSGAPIVGAVVTFSGDATKIKLSPASTALTAASGVAMVQVSPASDQAAGAGTLLATVLVGDAPVVASVDYQIVSTPQLISLAGLQVGSANVASGGNTPVSVTALINGAPAAGTPVSVSFSASCGRINGQDAGGGGVSVTTNGSGVAAAVYDAVTSSGVLCLGQVTLGASSAGAIPLSTAITVAAPVANAVSFLSASPQQIFVAGSGAVEQSIVKFKVFSSAGTAMFNVPVRFSIVTNPGDIGLGASGSTAATTATTSASGEVSVSVFSGTIPGPVKVRAALLADPTVFAESQNLTVASGPPSQRFMSLSVETFNIEAWALDGASTQLTVRIADRQGNAVEDGTVVNFTTEGGQVSRSCTTALVSGLSQCSVNFQSQNPRPAGGRVSVLAYLEGTKDYVDVNGNNRYDPGVDTLKNLGDAYRDDNENGQYDSVDGEFLIPRGGTLACAGAGEPFPARVNTCDNQLSTTVRQQAVILFSSSRPLPILESINASGIRFWLSSFDNPLLPLPFQTTVSAEVLDGTPSNGTDCTLVAALSGSPIPNIAPGTDPNADLATRHRAPFTGCASGDSVKITVTVPSGLKTSFDFPIP